MSSHAVAERMMRRAIELSKQGYPAPNPHVGCVIARGESVVGEGFHRHAGALHAEAMALAEAGNEARGAEVYVTLEPCNHQGRTPPCSEALIQTGVSSVTIACLDPNPAAAGGAAKLEANGISVRTGLLEAEAAAANELFLTAMSRKRPFVVGKAAMSLDGRVALPSGESKWITSEEAREQGHRLRAECGAVLVGRNTIVRDEPHLTARIPEVVNQPVRIVLDPNSALTGYEPVFGNDAPTWHVVKLPSREGHILAPMRGVLLDLRQLLSEFFARGVIAILVEGGPITLGHFIREGLLDRLELFMAPKTLGAGPCWNEIGVAQLADAPSFRLEGVKELGPDLWMTYRPARPTETHG